MYLLTISNLFTQKYHVHYFELRKKDSPEKIIVSMKYSDLEHKFNK